MSVYKLVFSRILIITHSSFISHTSDIRILQIYVLGCLWHKLVECLSAEPSSKERDRGGREGKIEREKGRRE